MQTQSSLFPIKNFQKNTYSYSKIKLFTQCKLRYKLKHLEKKQRQDQRTTYYLSLGRSIHRFFENFTLSNEFNKPTDEIIIQYLTECWDSRGYKTSDDEKIWFDRSKRMIRDFLSNTKYLRKPLLVEKQFRNKFEGFELTSIIDRIDRINNTQCEIIDYKVGKKELKVDYLKDDFQWAFHFFSSKDDLRKIYNLEISKITFFFLDANLSEVFIPEEELVQKAKQYITSKVNEIENEIDFIPTINKFCVDCRFDIICPLIQQMKNKGIDIQQYFD